MKYLKKYELFLNHMDKINKYAFRLIEDFYYEFKSLKDPNMVTFGNIYLFNGSMGIIKWDTVQYKNYKMVYNNKEILLSKETYKKINDIVKKIIVIKTECDYKVKKLELEKIIGKDIKKYVENKFQFYYNLEKDPKYSEEFLSSLNSIVIHYVACNFGSDKNGEYNYKNFHNNISSISVYPDSVIFNFGFKRFTNYKEYRIHIDWGNAFIQKWKPKIKKVLDVNVKS